MPVQVKVDLRDRDEPKYCCYVIPLGVHPTSISYVYKVFQHLGKPWMGIWVHPYTVMPVQVGEDFRKIGIGLSPNHVVMSWLRLQTHLESIPHPCHVNKN
jgi:hypothetical protein